MKIRVLKAKPSVPGKVGDVIEVDSVKGNRLAGLGLAVIVEHDEPAGAVSSVVANALALRHLERTTGNSYTEESDGTDEE